jgi:hypothetical protein
MARGRLAELENKLKRREKNEIKTIFTTACVTVG